MVSTERGVFIAAPDLRPSGLVLPEQQRTLDIERVRNITHSAIEELVTEDMIYASSDKGNAGLFHALFGRDTLLTALQALNAFEAQQERFGSVQLRDQDILRRSINGVFTLAQYQAKDYMYDGTVEPGHEIHERRPDNHEYLTAPTVPGAKPWRKNGEVMESFQSAEVTGLAALFKGRIASLGIELPKYQKASYRLNLEHCANSLERNGWISYTFDEDGEWGGLRNQGWMDSDYTMRHRDGKKRVYPMAPVEAQGIAWAALQYGADYFRREDPSFAKRLSEQAAALKARFNGPDGFAFTTREGKPYFAEAIDGNGDRVENVTSNPAFLMWAAHEGENIIDREEGVNIVEMLIGDEFFYPDAGLRTYSNKTTGFTSPDGYHEGPDTFWPLSSGIAAVGLYKAGFKEEARQIGTAALGVTDQFGSTIENVVMREGRLDKWRNVGWEYAPGQESCEDHVLTAGANHAILSLFY